MKDQEGVEMETMGEVAEAMVEVTLMAGLSLETGVAIEEDFLAVEVTDIKGLITWVATEVV